MGLELLEFDVFRFVGQPPGWTAASPNAEIDCGVVPTGQTWRADRITVGVSTTNAPLPLTVFLYDQSNPAPTAVPVDVTSLSQYEVGGSLGPNSWFDVDDASAPITIPAGNQLAIVFPGNIYSVNAVFSVRVQFSKYQGTSGEPQPAAGLTPAPSIPAAL